MSSAKRLENIISYHKHSINVVVVEKYTHYKYFMIKVVKLNLTDIVNFFIL